MEFKLKKLYNFNTRVPSILNAKYTEQRLKAILTHDQAVKYADISTLHTNVKQQLENIPENVTDLTYLLFESLDKKLTCIAYEYIETNSILEVESLNGQFTINNINTEDINVILNTLKTIGFNNIIYKSVD